MTLWTLAGHDHVSCAPGDGVTTADASPSFLRGNIILWVLTLDFFVVFFKSSTGRVCVAKRKERILKDAYIKVTKRLVRKADSGVIKWIIHVRKIDGFATESFNKLVTLRGSEMQTMLRVQSGRRRKKSWARAEKGRYRKREEKVEKHRLGFVAAVQRNFEWGQCQSPGDTCRNQHASGFSYKMPWWLIYDCLCVFVHMLVIYVVSCYG